MPRHDAPSSHTTGSKARDIGYVGPGYKATADNGSPMAALPSATSHMTGANADPRPIVP